MLGFLVVLLFFVWGYKLIKIIYSTKSIMGFTKEFQGLSRRYKYSNERKSEKYLIEAESYSIMNKKITISSLLWFFSEIGGMVVIYYYFVGKNPLILF